VCAWVNENERDATARECARMCVCVRDSLYIYIYSNKYLELRS